MNFFLPKVLSLLFLFPYSTTVPKRNFGRNDFIVSYKRWKLIHVNFHLFLNGILQKNRAYLKKYSKHTLYLSIASIILFFILLPLQKEVLEGKKVVFQSFLQ